MSVRNAFAGFWMVLGLAAFIVVGANVAVSMHRISTECAAASPSRGGAQ